MFKILWIDHNNRQHAEYFSNIDDFEWWLNICDDRGERVVFLGWVLV